MEHLSSPLNFGWTLDPSGFEHFELECTCLTFQIKFHEKSTSAVKLNQHNRKPDVIS